MECRGAALRLIATMLDSDLAPSDRAAAAFPEAGAMRWFVPALAIHPLSMSRCCVCNAFNDVAVVLYAHMRCGMFAADTVVERMATLAAFYLEAGAARDAVLFELLEQQAVGWVAWLVFNVNRQLEDPTLPATWKDALRGWVDSPHLQLDAASLHASLPTPSIVRTMARDYGRALLAWPQLWSFCRERFA